MKKKFWICALSAVLLAACAGTGDTSGAESSLPVSSEEPTTSVSSPIVELEADPVFTGISVSGTMIDLEIGRWLCVGVDYKCSFTFTDISNQTATISSSNPENIEVVENATNIFTLKVKQAGDTILRIYDADGVLHYRRVVKGRNRIPEEDVYNYLINVDHFDSYGINGKAKLTFLSSVNGVMSGKDGTTELGNINFSYELSGASSFSDDEYEFTITDFPNQSTDMICTKFYLDFTGCMLHLCTANITVDMFFPVTVA